jgi:hypothetical protein
MAALITMVIISVLYVVDVNFPLHLAFAKSESSKVRKFEYIGLSAVLSSQNLGRPLIPEGPVYTPDLCGEKIVIVSDSLKRINNYINNVLKGDNTSIKYIKIYNRGSSRQLTGAQKIGCTHFIHGYRKTIIRVPVDIYFLIDSTRNAIYYGSQLVINNLN